MIITTMQLHSAITGRESQLARITIINDGSGTRMRGNYRYSIRGKNDRVLKEGRIENWPRMSKTAIALLQKVLNTAYPKGAK